MDPINRSSITRAINVILSGLPPNRINRPINPIFRTVELSQLSLVTIQNFQRPFLAHIKPESSHFRNSRSRRPVPCVYNRHIQFQVSVTSQVFVKVYVQLFLPLNWDSSFNLLQGRTNWLFPVNSELCTFDLEWQPNLILIVLLN